MLKVGRRVGASRWSRLAMAAVLLGLAGFSPAAPRLIGGGADWATHNGGTEESSYSRLDQINTSNVGRLGLAWSLDLPGNTALEATPLAVNGVLYFTGTYAKVYAVDGVSGKVLWTFDPETWKHAPDKMHFGFLVNRGVAYAAGRIFAASFDGRLFALDAKTGRTLWVTETTGAMQTVTAAPRTFNGKVIIGQAGADFGARGYVTAYDQATGKQLWRFYVAPGSPEQNKGDSAMERAAATWNGEYWKTGTGGGPWDNITFDPELNRIYVGTGNASPYDPEARSPGGGDNLYTASIVALDADTGKYAWHYQLNPRDSWDFDSTQQMTVADLVIDGRPRKVLMQAPKNGFLYVLDRTNGKVISAGKIGKATWAERIDLETGRPVEAKNIRYETPELSVWPHPSGVHNWNSMSFNPKAGLVYIPTMHLGVRYTKGEARPGDISVGGVNMGMITDDDPRAGKGTLVAWDPVRQTERWKAPYDTLLNGGVLSTAGGLVFQGDGDGVIYAYDAESGRRLWSFDAGLGIIAAPMSWSKGGKQYVSLLVGHGGGAAPLSAVANVGWKFSQTRRLLTFALDGKAKLPPGPRPSKAVHAVDDPSIKIDEAAAKAGAGLYMACGLCHGSDLVGAGSPAPDLRESRLALDPNAFYSVVHDGALLPRGMPRFENLSREQVMQLYAYIRSGARKAAAAER